MRSPRGTQGGDRHDKGARELEDVQGELIVIGGDSPADGTKVAVKRVQKQLTGAGSVHKRSIGRDSDALVNFFFEEGEEAKRSLLRSRKDLQGILPSRQGAAASRLEHKSGGSDESLYYYVEDEEVGAEEQKFEVVELARDSHKSHHSGVQRGSDQFPCEIGEAEQEQMSLERKSHKVNKSANK